MLVCCGSAELKPTEKTLEAKGKHTLQKHPEWYRGSWGIYTLIFIIIAGGFLAGGLLLSPQAGSGRCWFWGSGQTAGKSQGEG